MGVRTRKISNDKPLINEHDLTKMMLNKVREGLITEEKNQEIVLDGPELAEEKSAFEEYIKEVGNIKSYGKLIVYPYDDNVVWSGEFHDGVVWSYSLRDGSKAEANMELDDKSLELITKLKKYGENWQSEWAKKLRDDYKSQSDDFRR